MGIERIVIKNFKCFKGNFELVLNKNFNLIVGNNEAGKSTILEAIHLALTGIYCGKNIQSGITQYLFNTEIVDEYLNQIKSDKTISLPSIVIEIYFDDNESAIFQGNNNSKKEDKCKGIKFEISYDEAYNDEYRAFIECNNINSLPIEYYEARWITFARDSITVKSIPIKSSMVDSSNFRYYNGSDIYVSRIVKNMLSEKEITSVIRAHRKMKEAFMQDNALAEINTKIESNEARLTSGKLSISINLGTKNSWEENIITQLNDIPFNYIGKGAQCILKTELALNQKLTQKSQVLLLEEPESHLSFSKLNELLSNLLKNYSDKQIIISSHSSFLVNKLGLNNLILLNKSNIAKLNNLACENFFKKIAGYDTLRLVLCHKVILVEGASDELIIQKAYFMKYTRLPIEDGIDVISVGTSFLRFLELAEKLHINVNVVTDNDGNIQALEKKYKDYINQNKKDNILICYDSNVDSGELEDFNYNTLEPKLVKANNDNILLFSQIFDRSFSNLSELHKFMKQNKTECALQIFEYNFNDCPEFKFPDYILKAIEYES